MSDNVLTGGPPALAAAPRAHRALMQPMTQWRLKMAVSVVLDLADLSVGAFPVVGHGKELATVPLAMLLWGGRGVFYGWELVDVTNLIDGVVPTAAAIGWSKRTEYQRRQREWEAAPKHLAP